MITDAERICPQVVEDSLKLAELKKFMTGVINRYPSLGQWEMRVQDCLTFFEQHLKNIIADKILEHEVSQRLVSGREKKS